MTAVGHQSLCPKIYSNLKADILEERKAKGVEKYVVTKYIHHEQYKEALLEGWHIRHEINTLRSRGRRTYGAMYEQDFLKFSRH